VAQRTVLQRTVRDATFTLLRRLGMTTIFGNPGSTEIPLLTGLPGWMRYVLALQEGSAVGIATGHAIASGEPALVNLHGAPGLGNAVNAIANARDCRAPLVLVVGQQDRRQLAAEAFLTGRGLERLAGDYTVWSSFPASAQDVPGAIARAYHEAQGAGGPALVVVPMGDWAERMMEYTPAPPGAVVRPGSAPAAEVTALADLIAASRSPALVVGAGSSSPQGWAALTALAERLSCPVWQEPFASRAGFPADHPLFAGYLPWRRKQLHQTLMDYDLVLTVGTSAFRGYLFDEEVPLIPAGTVVAVLTSDPAEAYRSQCELAVVAPVAPVCAAMAESLPARSAPGSRPGAGPRAPALPPPDAGEPLTPGHVFTELARRLPADAVVVEETPSSRPELLAHIPPRTPLGFLANGGGALGFGLSGAVGAKLALPGRPVVAVVGDGSALYTIQSLWTAAHHRIGVLVVVMRNGRYAIMDELAAAAGGRGAWPEFAAVDIASIAGGFGCRSITVRGHDELVRTLDEIGPGMRERSDPLLVDVVLG
jgi:benzoylformate decarboxylase